MFRDKHAPMCQSSIVVRYQIPFLKKFAEMSKGKNVMLKLKKYVKLSRMSMMRLKNVKTFIGVKFAIMIQLILENLVSETGELESSKLGINLNKDCDVKAESFYSVKYGLSNITSIIPSNNLFCFMSFQIFFLTICNMYWHFVLFWL